MILRILLFQKLKKEINKNLKSSDEKKFVAEWIESAEFKTHLIKKSNIMPDINEILKRNKQKRLEKENPEAFIPESEKSNTDRYNEILVERDRKEKQEANTPHLYEENSKNPEEEAASRNDAYNQKFDPGSESASRIQNLEEREKAEFNPSDVNRSFVQKNQDVLTIGLVIILLFLLYRFFKKR
jgi:hypothetical protein